MTLREPQGERGYAKREVYETAKALLIMVAVAVAMEYSSVASWETATLAGVVGTIVRSALTAVLTLRRRKIVT